MAKGPAIKVGDEVFPVNKLTNTVGRHDRITNSTPDVDLADLDTDRGVSRKHAELTYANGAIVLRDSGSINGTKVNGEGLPPQVDRYLQDGDQVSFGGLATVFVAQAEWPLGVEAEWPLEPGAAGETMVMAPGVGDTMVMPALDPEQPSIAPPAEAAEDAGVEPGPSIAPPAEAAEDAGVEPGPSTAPPAEAAEDEAEPAAAAEPDATTPEETDIPTAAAVAAVFTPCSNHPDIAAIGTCPGCLEAFCAVCMPERPGQPLICTRCVGIQERLSMLVGQGGPWQPATSAAPPPAPAPVPEFQPQPGFAPPSAPDAVEAVPPPGFPPPPQDPPPDPGFQPQPGFAAPPAASTVETVPPPPGFPPPPQAPPPDAGFQPQPGFAASPSPQTVEAGFPAPPSQAPDPAPPAGPEQEDPPKRKKWPF